MAELRKCMCLMPIDRAFATEVGNVIVQWSYLEQTFNDLIEAAYNLSANPPERNWRQLRPKQKRNLLADLCAEAFVDFPRINDSITKLIEELADLSIDRNLLAHGTASHVFPSQTEPIRLVVKGRYNGKDHEREYSVSYLQQIVARLAEVHGTASMLMSDDLSENDYPGWSPAELSALRGFRPNSPLIRTNSSTP